MISTWNGGQEVRHANQVPINSRHRTQIVHSSLTVGMRYRSGIKSTGQRALGSQSAHILRIPGMSHRKKTSRPDLSSRQAEANAFWLRAASIIGRVFCPYGLFKHRGIFYSAMKVSR